MAPTLGESNTTVAGSWTPVVLSIDVIHHLHLAHRIYPRIHQKVALALGE
jgi:hypothetical protein